MQTKTSISKIKQCTGYAVLLSVKVYYGDYKIRFELQHSAYNNAQGTFGQMFNFNLKKIILIKHFLTTAFRI